MRKKIAAAALCICLAASLTACQSNATETQADATAADGSAADSSNEESAAEETREMPTFDYSEGLEDTGYMTDLTAVDYVELPEYKGVEISEADAVPDQATLDALLESVLNSYATEEEMTDTERLIEDTDVVNIDYSGSVDGELFDGGSAEGYDLDLGNNTFIEGFADQIVGHKLGEEFDITVTFPDPYTPNEDLAGKEAVFHIKVNKVTTVTVPELTDAFVKENLQEQTGCETAEAFKEYLKKNKQDSLMMNYMWEYLRENATVKEIPQSLYDVCYDYQNFSADLQAYQLNMTKEEMMELVSMSEDSLDEYTKSMAEEILIAQAVAEKENIQIDDAYLEETYQDQLDSYLETYGDGYVKRSAILNKVAKIMADNAVIVENAETEAETES